MRENYGIETMEENKGYLYHGLNSNVNFRRMRNTPAVMKNRLEALTVLINSVMLEVEELKENDDINEREKINFDEEVKRFEINLIRCALMRTGGVQRRAAALLNIKVTTLNAKIKRFGIAPNGLSEETDQFS